MSMEQIKLTAEDKIALELKHKIGLRQYYYIQRIGAYP